MKNFDVACLLEEENQQMAKWIIGNQGHFRVILDPGREKINEPGKSGIKSLVSPDEERPFQCHGGVE